MAKNKKNKPLFGGFDRLQSFPLDSSSVYETWAELEAYCSSPIAYQGQIVVCLDKSNNLEHYGAYAMMSITEQNAANRYCVPMKLAGSTEFTNKVADLYDITTDLRNKLDDLKEREVIQLQQDVADTINWLNHNARDVTNDNALLLATKSEVEDLNNRLTSEVQRIFGEQIDSINEVIGQKDTINEIAAWIDDHQALFESDMTNHAQRIAAAEANISRNSDSIETLATGLLNAVTEIYTLKTRITELAELEARVIANEEAIQDIEEELNSVEHITEYEFTSVANISGVLFTPNMRIKTIEIVIDETGENVPNGIYNDNTTLSVELASATNPQNVARTIIDSNEIIVLADTKLVFDLDVIPPYNSYLRFKAGVSNGMRGHALVTYYTKVGNVAQPVQALEPAGNGGGD